MRLIIGELSNLGYERVKKFYAEQIINAKRQLAVISNKNIQSCMFLLKIKAPPVTLIATRLTKNVPTAKFSITGLAAAASIALAAPTLADHWQGSKWQALSGVSLSYRF